MIWTFRCGHCGHVTAVERDILHFDSQAILACASCTQYTRLSLRPLVEEPRSLAESLGVLIPALLTGSLPRQSLTDVEQLLDTLVDATKVVSGELARRQAECR